MAQLVLVQGLPRYQDTRFIIIKTVKEGPS